MITALLTIVAFVAPGLAQERPDLRGVHLISSADTAFILPFEGLDRDGDARSATLIGAYPKAGADEPWLAETRFEFKCAEGAFRIVSDDVVRGDGSRSSLEPGGDWTDGGEIRSWPPYQILETIVCGDVKLDEHALADWRAKLPELTASLTP